MTPANLSASVHDRLLNLQRVAGVDFNLLLTRYATERLLYRMVACGLGDRFVLKGAMLFAIWTDRFLRPTRDMDLLGFGDLSEATLKESFRRTCIADVEPDGMRYDGETIAVEDIREEQAYHGRRVLLVGYLGKARVPLQVDIGFGDTVVPAPEEISYPALLGFPGPTIRAYARETVVAEKLHALVALGMRNSRMKDFFDLRTLSALFSFEGYLLSDAIRATFGRRSTVFPSDTPTGLSDEFAIDPVKATQWKAFLRRSKLTGQPDDFREVVHSVRNFLLPPMRALRRDSGFASSWKPGGPWTG